MRVILCNVQMFSNDQMIQVIDTDRDYVYYQKVDIENLPEAICTLAKEHGIENVKLSGGRYAELWASAVLETNEMNYGSNNNLIVEVM